VLLIPALTATPQMLLEMKILKSYPHLKKKPYWGNHFWARGYCVDTIGLDEEKIKKYVKYQEYQERLEEQQSLEFSPL
jgi:putative transposase